MRRNKVILAFFAIALVLSMCACGQTQNTEEEKPDFSQAREIARLSTLECTYHNVAEFFDDGTQLLKGLTVGYKKAWIEYDGTVTLGVDASKVDISDPDENGKVIITLPEAEVQSSNIVKDSLSRAYTDTGLITEVTTEDQTVAVEAAQNQMVESVRSNEALMNQARSRAGILLRSYVEKVGSALDKTYSVSFVDEEGNELRIVDGSVEKLSKQTERVGTEESAESEKSD